MVYGFLEKKKEDGRLETELRLLKDVYRKPGMTEEQLSGMQKKMEEAYMEEKKRRRKSGIIKFTAAAALAAGFTGLLNTSAAFARAMGQVPVLGYLVEAVTFRDYQYESDRNRADVRVPEIKVTEQEGTQAQENLKRTAEEINAEIKKTADRLVKEFEDNLAAGGGCQDITVDSEVVSSTDDYFTLKLNCYQGAGSGYAFNYFYTIDLKTGKRMQLKDVFKDGADYITPVSRSIKKQMKEQMAADENVIYWLDHETDEWNFKEITEDTSFYLDEKGQIVVCFNEGDVAPMYMGAVEFVIPQEAVDSIRR